MSVQPFAVFVECMTYRHEWIRVVCGSAKLRWRRLAVWGFGGHRVTFLAMAIVNVEPCSTAMFFNSISPFLLIWKYNLLIILEDFCRTFTYIMVFELNISVIYYIMHSMFKQQMFRWCCKTVRIQNIWIELYLFCSLGLERNSSRIFSLSSTRNNNSHTHKYTHTSWLCVSCHWRQIFKQWLWITWPKYGIRECFKHFF